MNVPARVLSFQLCMAALLPVAAVAQSAGNDAGTIRVNALRASSLSGGAVAGSSQFGQVILNGSSTDAPNRADYAVLIPAAGQYNLRIRYAAALARPINVTINRQLIRTDALNEPTGCWEFRCQKWVNVGTVDLPEGAITLTLSRNSVFPHISEIEFTSTLSTQRASSTAAAPERFMKSCTHFEAMVLPPVIKPLASKAPSIGGNPVAVLGINLGMRGDDAIIQLAKDFPGAKFGCQNRTFNALNVQTRQMQRYSFPVSLEFEVRQKNTDQFGVSDYPTQFVALGLLNPVSGFGVSHISNRFSFGKLKGSYSALRSEIAKKYGPPLIDRSQQYAVNRPDLFHKIIYAWSKTGVSLANSAVQTCIETMHGQRLFAGPLPPACDSLDGILAYRMNDITGDAVDSLHVFAIDLEMYRDDFNAVTSFIQANQPAAATAPIPRL